MQVFPIEFFLSLFLLFHQTSGEEWTCKPDGVIHMNLSAVTNSFPITFGPTSAEAVAYLSNMNCTWMFEVPPGQYAVVNVFMKLRSTDMLSISNGKQFSYSFDNSFGDVPEKGNPVFYLPSGTSTMQLVASGSKTVGLFSFTAKLQNLPKTINQVDQKPSTQVIPLESLLNTQYHFYSANKFTLRTVRNGCDLKNLKYDVCHVYKGVDVANGTFEAGLSAYLDGFPTVFEGDVTVTCLAKPPENSFLLFTPMPTNVNNFTWNAFTYPSCTTLNVNGEVDVAAFVTTYCPSNCTQYLTEMIIYPESAALTIFHGVIGAEGHNYWDGIFGLRKYNYLPQQINGGLWKTYVATSGVVKATLGDGAKSWETASVRRGFFNSPNFGELSSYQSATTNISSEELFWFQYNVTHLFSGTMIIKIDLGNNTAQDVTIDASNFETKGQGWAEGYGLSMKYDIGNDGPSKGASVDFWIEGTNLIIGKEIETTTKSTRSILLPFSVVVLTIVLLV